MVKQEMQFIFMDIYSCEMLGLFFSNDGFCVVQVNPKEEHDSRGIDGLYYRDNALDDIVALFLCHAWRLGKDNGEPCLMSLELGVIPCLEENLFIVIFFFLMKVLVFLLMQGLNTWVLGLKS